MELKYKYRPSSILLISILTYLILFLSIAIFVFVEGNVKDRIIPFLLLHTTILSPFIYLFIYWFYYRKQNKKIIVEDNSVMIPHRWKNKVYEFKYDDIIYLDKYKSYDIKHEGMIIEVRDRHKNIVIKKTWMEKGKSFDELYEILRSKFAKIESNFMIHWNTDTPFSFKQTTQLVHAHIQYKNITSMFPYGEDEYPQLGQIWLNKKKYSQDYFSGPLLTDDNHHIYLPYFEGPCFILARINLKTGKMILIGDRHEVICLERIENKHIYFYNDAFGKNILQSYDLNDKTLHHPFTINTKGLKRKQDKTN